MKDFLVLFKSKLARRTVLYVLLFSSIITLTFTSLQLYREYRSGVQRIEQEIGEIKSTSLKALEENLWLLNINSINLMLEGILQNKDVVHLAIYDENGKLLTSRGVRASGHIEQHNIPLSYTYQGRVIPLGHLKISTTLENVYNELIDTISYILVTQAIKTFAVSTFILFLVWLLISRHLSTIQQYAEKLRLGHSQQDLELNRRQNHWTNNDELSSLVKAINRMRREIQDSYAHIRHLSLHDSLTGLPNRRYLEKQLMLQAVSCQEGAARCALLFLDLDHFKLLNDSLGHSTGDQLLVEIARRISVIVEARRQEGDLVARIGGDEFVILITQLPGEESPATDVAIELAEDIKKCIAENISVGGKKYKLGASIGIALYQGGQSSYETLLKQADNALHDAKTSGRNRITVFRPELQRQTDMRLESERQLHIAIQQEEFILLYQPKVDRDRKVCSAEALVRWKRADGQLILPNQFIPIAEETGLIVEIGQQIISSAFHFVKANQDHFLRWGIDSISINVSARQFIDPGFADLLIDKTRYLDIDPGFFILEITEDAMIQSLEDARLAMQRLKKNGFRLSIDDFGTGYSSLSYLKDLPLDELKIDKSFIDHIVGRKNDRSITLSIIEIAQNLGLNVVAEGVETPEQFSLLCSQNCQLFQGYLFSKPLSDEDFLRFIQNEKLE